MNDRSPFRHLKIDKAPRALRCLHFRRNAHGTLKGSLTFSRYRVKGDLPAEFRPFFDKQIKKYAFQELTASAEDQAFGWTSLENPSTRASKAPATARGIFLFRPSCRQKVHPAGPAALEMSRGGTKVPQGQRQEAALPRADQGDQGARVPPSADQGLSDTVFP